jgi:hypothetical protein
LSDGIRNQRAACAGIIGSRSINYSSLTPIDSISVAQIGIRP